MIAFSGGSHTCNRVEGTMSRPNRCSVAEGAMSQSNRLVPDYEQIFKAPQEILRPQIHGGGVFFGMGEIQRQHEEGQLVALQSVGVITPTK